MICKVITALERFSMLEPGTVAVGLSGGADSVALLNILYGLRERYSVTLTAAHVNHCLRGEESERDELFVRRLCERMGIPLTVKRADAAELSRRWQVGLEEGGRRIRYEFFESLNTDMIATAHTLSDSAETMLINLSRGCSLSGLCSIPPVRGKIIRPLILCTSGEVRQYCKDNGLEYVTDSSNLTGDYTRNRVRHTVIPALENINPSFVSSVGRCLDSLRDDCEYLAAAAAALLSRARLADGFDAQLLKSAHVSVSRRAVYRLLYDGSGVMPERKHIDALLGILGGGAAQLCGGLLCRCENGVLTFPKPPESVGEWETEAGIRVNETPYSSVTLMSAGRLFYDSLSKRERGTRCFDLGKTVGRLTLRSRKAGDRLTDLHRGNTKTLKKLFNEAGTPPEERGKTAVLCDERGIVWVEGFCVDARCAVDEGSEHIIYVKSERK